MTADRGMLVQQLLEKVVELVGGELWGSEEFGLKIGFKDGEVDSREFPGLNIHWRAREAGETELRHDAVFSEACHGTDYDNFQHRSRTRSVLC